MRKNRGAGVLEREDQCRLALVHLWLKAALVEGLAEGADAAS